jgi:ATP-dependent Clp protease ATP-binding subunit ClpB
LIHQRVMAEVRGSFRPEFLNRVDDIVIFHRLGPDHLRQIVDIQVGQLQRRLAERKVTIDLTDKAREWLSERGFDPAYGARPLKRLIQREISDALALKLLQGEFGEGDTVEVDAVDGGLAFRKA